jgi:hypothetical protein
VHPYPHFFPDNLSDSREAMVISESHEMVIAVYAFDSVDTRLPSGLAVVADKGYSDNVLPIATHGYSSPTTERKAPGNPGRKPGKYKLPCQV